MKKQFLTGLAVLAAASMLCGFDSAETIDTLGEKMTEAGNAVESVSGEMNLNLDAALSMSDGTTSTDMTFVVSGPIELSCTLEPLAVKLDGSLAMSMMGQNETLELQTYTVTDGDGVTKTYTQNNGTWSVKTSDNPDLSKLVSTLTGSSLSFSDLEELGLSFELAPEAADVDGTECYLLSCVIDDDAIHALIEKASEQSGTDLAADDSVATALAALTGLRLNLNYYVDASSYLPAKIHMDFNDSDLTALNQLVADSAGTLGEGTSITLTLNDLSFDMTVSYNDAAEIIVPEEALAAETE